MTLNKKYDVIIIGAGIGGLICGCFLAKAKKKVLIIEQHDKAGGCVTAIKRKGCIFDMGGHLFGSCNARGILSQCLSNVGVEVDFIRLDPADQFTIDDDFIEVPAAMDKYIEVLKGMFPQEAKKIELFFKQIVFLAINFNNIEVVKKFNHLTYQELLDSYFTNKKLKSILAAQYLYIGSKPQNASAIFMAVLLSSYLRDGVYYPKGGTQVFSDAILKKFIDYGGICLFKNLVKSILLDKANKKAIGVKLEDETQIYSSIVISNADAYRTFFNLVNRRVLPASFVNRMQKYERSIPLFLTFIALKSCIYDLKRHRGWHFSSYDMNGRNNPLYIFIPSLLDPSLAPTDVHILEVLMEFPFKYHEVKDWKNCKEAMQIKIMERLRSIMGPLDAHLLYVDSATPKTFERYTLNSGGVAYGWSMIPRQTTYNRLQHETPLKNLYLVGHWTTPGCGIPSVAVSGWSLSKKILNS